MNYLIDTHILLWWCLDRPQLLGPHDKILFNIESHEEVVGLSIISFWEIAKLVVAKRYDLARPIDEWFDELEQHPNLKILPLTAEIILDSTRLGSLFPKDPADQLIAATARSHGLRLMTADERIIQSRVVAIA